MGNHGNLHDKRSLGYPHDYHDYGNPQDVNKGRYQQITSYPRLRKPVVRPKVSESFGEKRLVRPKWAPLTAAEMNRAALNKRVWGHFTLERTRNNNGDGMI